MLKTFSKGGVHPDENKLSKGKKIEVLPLPEMAYIPVSQHLGVPSKPLVAKGDKVKVGQVIAESGGFVSSTIHSSVSGTVERIDKLTDHSGFKRDTIVIKVEGDEWMDAINHSDEIIREISLSKEEIIQKVLAAGIVGLGGATFPSHVKLTLPKDKKVEYLVINGVECEPYLTSDHRLMLEKGEEILIGANILAKALGVNKIIVGIEANKPDAINHLTTMAENYGTVRIQGLKVKYPQGGEKQLIKALLNREVPCGGLPMDVGAVVFNVGSAFAVYEAVQKNKPLIERVVTVTGKEMEKPANFWVRLGTPVSKLIEAAGGVSENTGKVINGGPMMGKALGNLDVPIVKGSSGIVLLPEQEAKRKEVKNCIRCSKCVSVCPMGLEPYILMVLSEKEIFKKLQNHRVLDCVECGSCSYVCPSNRPLLDYIRLGKSVITKLKNKN